MQRRNFGIFILSHQRANNVITLRALERTNNTYPWWLIIDNEDPQLDEYLSRFGNDRVIVFDKSKYDQVSDTGDSLRKRNSPLWARNAAFDIAKELKLEYFLVLDDDYVRINHRFIVNQGEPNERDYNILITNMDAVNEAMLDLLEDTGADCVAMAQGGDFIGGRGGIMQQGITFRQIRKIMNSFYFRTDNPIRFMSRMNDDVTTYVVHGGWGRKFFTCLRLQINQAVTQQNSGGITPLYLESGTYIKSFYSVMFAPSCVKISCMGRTDDRFHHRISWNNAVPRIISPQWRKPELIDA